jgi:hypothetical protein
MGVRTHRDSCSSTHWAVVFYLNCLPTQLLLRTLAYVNCYGSAHTYVYNWKSCNVRRWRYKLRTVFSANTKVFTQGKYIAGQDWNFKYLTKVQILIGYQHVPSKSEGISRYWVSFSTICHPYTNPVTSSITLFLLMFIQTHCHHFSSDELSSFSSLCSTIFSLKHCIFCKYPTS